MNPSVELLESFISSRRPIIYVPHFDALETDRTVEAAAATFELKIREFHYGKGEVNFVSKAVLERTSLEEFLLVLDTERAAKSLIVLTDCHPVLTNPTVMALLKSMAYKRARGEGFERTLLLVSPVISIPRELEHLVTVLEIPTPTQADIEQLIETFARHECFEVSTETKRELALSLRGLSRFQVDQILRLAYESGGSLNDAQKNIVVREKEQLIKKSGLLESVTSVYSVEEIGGLDNFKTWLKRKARIFSQLEKARRAGVAPPRGVLIVGMPGCGKSLAAKATAHEFGLPLLRLDIGKLLGRYIGESEENMRRALSIAESVSPCVLWIDELEKAFSGLSDATNPTVARLFGFFLTWVQETDSNVFVVATANDIDSLPPEFLRKGRFDELFFVDFPTLPERREVLEKHLKKRSRGINGLDLDSLAQRSDGFCGADLEAVVKEAIEASFLDSERRMTTEDLLAALNSTVPLSKSQKDKIAKLQAKRKELQFKAASVT